MLKLETRVVAWPLRVPFTISRETLHDVPCIQVSLTDAAGHVGRAEAVGVDYAGETPDTMVAQIEDVRTVIEAGIDRTTLQLLLPAGGARNAIDCALWDLEAKQTGVRVWQRAGLGSFDAQPTAFTLGIMPEAQLRETARRHAHFAVLKVKTNRLLGLDPVRIVQEEAPHARLIVDPNQAWGADELNRFGPKLRSHNVALLEQPVAVDGDDLLLRLSLPVPVAADEAFTDRASIDTLMEKYQVLNIKLDKTGGLTEALACAHAGKARGFSIMVGCMVGSSLSMAPGTIIAQLSQFVDLDGPLLQSSDCDTPITYAAGTIGVPSPELWG
jgi:L-Ala-D/L-Glu epimerase